MQTLALNLQSAPPANSHREKISLALVIAIHAGLIAAALWTPSQLLVPPQAAAPKVMEISLLTTAPPQPPTELTPGPQQVEAAAAPKPIVKSEEKPELLTNEKAERTINTPPPKPEPVQEEVKEEPPEEVVAEQVTPAPPAPETTAPTAPPAPPAESASAAVAGADQQQLLEVQLNWQQQLQLHLEKRKRYPRRAQMRHQEGVPMVRFTMDRAGKVLNVELVSSSGVETLDAEATALIKRAQPLPPPPADIPGENITLTVPIEFFINR